MPTLHREWKNHLLVNEKRICRDGKARKVMVDFKFDS